MHVAPGGVDLVALAKRIEAIALPGMQLASQRQCIQHGRMVLDFRLRVLHEPELMLEETHVETRVVNHEFSAVQILQQFIDDLGEPRRDFEILQADAVNTLSAFINIAIRVQKAMKFAPRQAAVNEFETADFDDAVALGRRQAGGFSIEDDLSHSSSMPRLASSSAISLPALPVWPFTQRQSISWRPTASSSACHKSWFFTGFLAAVFQPRFFQFGSQSLMPSMTYLESVCRITRQGRSSVFSASMAAVSSMRLFVVSGAPPCSVLRCLPEISRTPQPPGPGLPLHAPSVYISIAWVKSDA